MIHRTEWVRLLTALPDEQLLSTVTNISKDWDITPKSIPQSGLGMLKLKDSAFEEPFYLGEFPLSTAWVEITTPDGLHAEGSAQVMLDKLEIAESLAVCDAVLSAKLPGWEILLEFYESCMTPTRYFSLLDDAGGSDVTD